jgi:signal transduction histidine kinase
LKHHLILIVDDDVLSQGLVSGIIAVAKPNSRTIVANNGHDALAMCREQAIDCVLVDYEMPDMDGLTLVRLLREEYPFLPIILCTGAGDELLAAETLKSGATDYFPKNRMSPVALRRAINTAIELNGRMKTIHDQQADIEAFGFALAHDFKQPVRQIITFSGMIAQETRRLKSDRLPQMLKFMNDAARRLDSLVDVMVQYTLLQQTPELNVCIFSQILKETIASLQDYIGSKNAKVTFKGDALVLVNTSFLSQVLQNLIINGIKYNKSEEPLVEITVSQNEDVAVVNVTDNGIGIERQYLEHVFKPLTRLHNRTEYEGSGLGLTLARKAVLAMGGDIRCDSTPGVGSTFSVKLKTASAQEAAA